jgi:hypothetical protein
MVVTISNLDAFISVPGLRMMPTTPTGTPFELGTEIMRGHFSEPRPEMDVDPEFSFSVGVENAAGEVVDRLRQVLDFIDRSFLSRAAYT